MILRSAVVRYFSFNLRARARIYALFTKKDHGKTNMDQDIYTLCRYILSQCKKTLTKDQKLLLVMNADTDAIHKEQDPKTQDAYMLNTMTRRVADELSIPFIDLTEAFLSDYRSNNTLFTFKIDGHWNKRTHLLVGGLISRFIQERGWCTRGTI